MIEVVIDDPRWVDAALGVEAAARAAGALALEAAAGHASVVILLTDDGAMRALCARFLGQDKATNVLAFPAAPGATARLGDIALAFGVCAKEAREQGKTLIDHLRHLVIHGVLHLQGHDHQRAEAAAAMEALEITLLARLGVADPFADRSCADAHAAAR